MKRQRSGQARGPARVHGDARGDGPSWLSRWIEGIGAPTWVSSPDGRIHALNERAEELLGTTAAELRAGLRCFEVVQGRRARDGPFCSRRCPVRRSVEKGMEVDPVTIELGRGRYRGKWIQMLVIPLWKGSWLLHCALDAERAHCMQEYLARVATRNLSLARGEGLPDPATLTRREREVLHCLARDHDSQTVAAMLHVSHSTVRNHVRHILKKLGVNSIQEAVAVQILTAR